MKQLKSGARIAAHPAADLFPMIEGAEMDALVEDIRAHGQREPCWIYEGRLLDGRNRWAACKRLGIEPKTREFKGDEKAAIDLVVSLNIARRHLTPTQKGCIALEVVGHYAEAAAARKAATQGRPRKGEKPTQRIGEDSDPHSRESAAQAAAVTGANRQYVSDAGRLRERAPDVYELAKRGQVTMPEAKRLASVPAEDRAAAMAAVKSKEARNITAAVGEVKKRRARAELSDRAKASPKNAAQRVICGEAVEQLRKMKAGSAHCCITDPPYGIDVHRTRKGGKDYADGEDYALALLEDVCVELERVLTEDAHIYVFSGYTHVQKFKEILGRHFDVQDNPIVWVKNKQTMIAYDQWYASKHEYVLFARRTKARPLAAKCSVDVLECASEPGVHSAAKPVKLLRHFIENSTVQGETVIDPFAGSGRTLLAAKSCERNAVGIEVDAEMSVAAQGALA